MDPVEHAEAVSQAARILATSKKASFVRNVSEGKFGINYGDGINSKVRVNQDRVDYLNPENHPRVQTMSDAQAGLKEQPRSMASSTAEPAAVVTQAPSTPAVPAAAPVVPAVAAPQRSQPTQPGTAAQPAPTPAPASPTVKLVIGGVETEMPASVVADLVAKGREVQSAQEMQKQAQQLRTQLGIDAQWSEFLAQAHPSRKQAIMELTRELGPLGQRIAAPSMDEPAETSAPAPVNDPRFDQLANTVHALAQDATARYQREQLATRERSLDQVLGQTPVFQRSAPARDAAKQSILREIQLNPSADLSALVATEAQRYTAILGTAGQPASAPASAVTAVQAAVAASSQSGLTSKDFGNPARRRAALREYMARLG